MTDKKTWRNLPPHTFQKKWDLTGRRFGKLKVILFSGKDSRKALKWLCKCDCGNKTITLGKRLRPGLTKSCGCLIKEINSEIHKTHGMKKSPEYKIWAQMKARCLNRNNLSYYRYGGRGIKVCKRWESSFVNFYKDMKLRPTGKSLERNNNDGDYKPSNCIWADRKTQIGNRSNSIKIDLMAIAKKRGISYKHAWSLHKNGRL